MKINIDFDRIRDFLKVKKNQEYIAFSFVIMVIVIFGALTYLALVPGSDEETVLEGEERVTSINAIRFNTKLLNELGATTTPSSLDATGGRNPFTDF